MSVASHRDKNRRAQFERMAKLHRNGTPSSGNRVAGLPKDPAPDPEKIQSKRFTRRLFMLGAGSAGLFGLLGQKLHTLQNIEGRKYKSMAEDNRLSVRFSPATRGRILDRTHTPIASNIQNLRVLLVPERADDIAASLDRLAHTIPLSERRRRRVLQIARRQNPQIPILVADGLSWKQFARINVLGQRIPGIITDTGWRRHYHHGREFAHLVGHLGPPNELQLAGQPALHLPGSLVGVAGIEQGFDRVLRGAPGRTELEVDARGKIISELDATPPRAGEDLFLTLDHVLQQRILKRLSSHRRAAAVALDIHSGDVVALCSTPSFDPNILTPPVDENEWKKLQKAPDHPLSDKATRGQYPPGSTFKMVTALAGLEAGVISARTSFNCPGFLEVQNHRFHCWNRSGHGHMALHRAMKQSCDVYFYQTARKVGIRRMARMARLLGLGQTYDCGLPGQKPGLIPDPDWKQVEKGRGWYEGETVMAGIGQGYVLATPLQLAVMTARIASGRKITPRLAFTQKTARRRLAPRLDLDNSALKLIRKAMTGVVNEPDGTGKKAGLDWPGLQLAGKTGTSQVRSLRPGQRGREVEWKYRDHALFVAYAPADNPRYALSLIIEHGGSGGKAAAPVARDIMKMLLIRDPARQVSQANLANQRGDL